MYIDRYRDSYLLMYLEIDRYRCIDMYLCIYEGVIISCKGQSSPGSRRSLCSADGSTHTESNKLYRKVKHRYRPNLSPRQRPTAKARHDQAALAASAEARGATHRARPRSPSRCIRTPSGLTRRSYVATNSADLCMGPALCVHVRYCTRASLCVFLC